jgi:hypothetical protein
VLWRCPYCGQLWQLSIAQGAWITVSAHDEAVLRFFCPEAFVGDNA